MPDPATMPPTPAVAELQALDRAVAMAVFAPDGTVIRANANFLQVFRYRTRELVGQPHAVLLPPDEADAPAEAELWDALRRGELRRVLGPRQRRDGQRVWVSGSYTPAVDRDGRIAEVVLLLADVSAEQLRAADERGQIGALDAACAVAHFGIDGSFLHANARFLHTTGHAAEDLIGAHHGCLVGADAESAAEEVALWSGLAEGRPQTGTYRRRGKGGAERWLRSSYTPIVDLDGRCFKVVLIATDVTADRAWRADCEGQLAAIDTSHAVITFDMNGTVLGANDNFLQAVGYRLDEIEGRHHRMFVEPSHAHGPEYAAFWNALSDGRHQAGEYRRLGKDGREVWLEASYSPIRDADGRMLKVVKYATDVTREKLRRSDHQGQIASMHNAQCVVSFSLDGRVLDANDNFLDATGYRLSEVRGRHHRMFVAEATAAGPGYLAFWNDLAQGRHHRGDFMRLKKDGSEIWLQAAYNAILDTNGRPFKVVLYATDVTEERLRQLDHEGQVAALDRSQCVASFGLDGTVLDANDNFLRRMGYDRQEVLGCHHRMFVDPADAERPEYDRFWRNLGAGRFFSDRYRRIGKGGREVWFQASYNPILDLHGRPLKVVKVAVDVTESMTLAAQVVSARRQAERDVLTRLPNRVGLTAYMAQALARPTGRLAVLYVDLDHFKPINDTFGHAVGDLVLKENGCRLRLALQPGQMAARIGGDEFVVVAPDLSDEQIDGLCQRLLTAVKAPIRHGDRTVTVGLSIGVAVSPDDAHTADDLLRCADVALYRTKGAGRDGYRCFAESMHERLSVGRHLADEMRHGIQAGQFTLAYEPQVDVRSRAVESVRALLCWDHPERGRLAAADFIALAERSALILPVGEWQLRTACQAAAGWPGIGLVVDISPVQMAGMDLAAAVQAALAESALPAHRLTLAMPEQVLQGEPGRLQASLDALKALGVRLLLDGPGAHPRPLGDLREFGFDELRIDPARIADIDAADGRHRLAQGLRRLEEAFDAAPADEGLRANGRCLILGLHPGTGAAVPMRGLWRGPAAGAQALADRLARRRPPIAVATGPRMAADARPASEYA